MAVTVLSAEVDHHGTVALLQIPGAGFPNLVTRADIPPAGSRVVVVGSPLGLARTVTEGIVSATRLSQGSELVQISAAISHGSSGGPVLDGHGRVFAIASAFLAEGQQLNFAIPVRYAVGLLATHPNPRPLGAPGAIPPGDLAQARIATPPPILNPGAWKVSDEKNPLDDTRTVTLTLFATSGTPLMGHPVVLQMRCQGHQTELFIDWGSYLGEEAEVTVRDVTFRVGNSAARTSAWGLSTDRTATFYPQNSVEFIKELVAAEFTSEPVVGRFVAQVTPYHESPITAVFDVRGLEFAMKPMREACGW